MLRGPERACSHKGRPGGTVAVSNQGSICPFDVKVGPAAFSECVYVYVSVLAVYAVWKDMYFAHFLHSSFYNTRRKALTRVG